MKFPCALEGHEHEVSQCLDFFKLSPVERWKDVGRSRVCYTCLRPRLLCKERLCSFYKKVPEVLKCQLCAPWAESRNLAPFSVLFCTKKAHGDARALLNVLKAALEKYIGKLKTNIINSSIPFSVNFMQEKLSVIESDTSIGSAHGSKVFPQTPMIDSETGYRVVCEDEDICTESAENSIYLMQNLRVGDSNYLSFFDSGANAHLIDGQMARQEDLQLISNKSVALGIIEGGSIRTEYGSFRFNLGPGEDGNIMRLQL